MDITGATFNFTKKVDNERENPTPEKPIDGGNEKKPKVAGGDNSKSDKEKNGNSLGAFAYDMIKTGVQQTTSAIMSSVSGSPTLQVQLQAAQQIGGKIIAYTAAVATGNIVALATMAISDTVSYGFKKAEYNRAVAWSDYDLDQYRERRGYSSLRNRK